MTVAAVIGGGAMGRRWAARFLMAGWKVRLFDPDRATAGMLGETLGGSGERAARLRLACAMSEAVAGADWIQESVPERLGLKRKVCQVLQSHCDPDAVIASSSIGFRPAQIQGCAMRPGQIIIARSRDPAALRSKVDLATSGANPPALVARARAALSGLGMLVHEEPL